KVVFSKARGALMVVNEATSSVQAKGTKTVIAAAVAALSLGAGVASAASVEYASAEIGSGASLTVTVDGSNTVLTPSGVVGTKADGTTGTLTKDDTVTGAYTLSGGELIINGASFTGTVAADTATKKANGTITLNSVAKSGTVTGVTYNAIEGTFSKLDLNLNVYNAAAGGQAGNVTIGENTKDLTIKEGTLKTGTIEGSSTAANKVAGTATITGKNLAFGVAPDPVGDKGETSATNPGSAYDFDNAANVKLDVTAEETVKFNKGTITNAGTMTVTGKTGVTVEKEVSIANTGDLTFKDDAKVDFKADYTASAGRLFIESADNTISGNITADSLKFGTRITDSDTAKETNQVVITGTTSNSNTIAYGSTVDVKALTVEDATTTINGTLKAATTAVTDKTTAGLTVQDTTGTTGKKQYAAVSLGDITVGSAASGATTGASFTLTNNAENAVEASSLTVVKNTGASTFTLGAGKFSVGKLTNQGTVTLTDGEFSLTGEGSNASGATINLANSMAASLVVAEGASLQNQGDIGTANTQGKIKVSGTLTNLPKIEAVGGTPAVKAGTITAAAVEVDGVLSTALDAATYNVAETTINTAGELQTSLNARLDGVAVADQKPADALEIANTITLEGKITAAGAEVQNYIVNATGGAFTIKEADKTFNTVQVKAGAFATDDADVTLSVLDVKDAGTAKVNGGTLNVTTLKTVAEKSVTVEDGTLATSLTGLGLKYTDSGFAAADATTAGAGKVAGKSIVLGTSSLLDLDLGSVTEVTSAQLTGLTGLVSDDATSKGLIDIGATQIKEVKEHITDGKIEYSELNGIAGVTNDTIKSLTVTKVGELISGKDAIYGTIEQGDFEAASKDFTITDVSLTLTGTGNLVSYTNTTDGKKVPTLSTIKFSTPDSELVTTGEGAQIGQIGDGSDATNGSLYVKSGDLTANGSVTINSLEVESGAKLSIADDKDGKGYAVKTGTATGEATAIISGELAAANSDVTFGSTATAANNADGTYSFDNVNKVTGKLAAKTLTLAGDMLVNQGGTVEAATLSGQTVYVGNSASAGSLSVGELAAGNIYAAPTWKEDGSAAAVSLVAVKKAVADTVVEAGRSSIVSVGTNDVTAGTAAFAKTGFTLAKTDDTKKEYSINTKTVNSVVYAEGLQYAGNVYAGNYDADVSIGANSMLLIDATKVDATGEKSVFVEAVNMAANSVLYVDNVKNGDKISLTATMSGTSINADLVHEGDLLMGADEDQFKKGVLEFGMHDKADVVDKLGNVAGLDAIYGMYENGENVGNTNAQFFRDLMSSQTSSAYDSAAGEWNFQTIRTTLNDVAAIGATTGAQAVTMDAVNQMADTVAARTSVLTQRAQGVNVWVDVNGGRFEGKKVMDGAGYSSDIYAGTLGADYQFANGAVLGAALTIGTADTDSKGTTAKTSMDSDLVGFSVYGSKTFADIWNVAGDI
ncbi:beta strand repeat-containing protein, partial [Sutterella wadsworthensis]|uniref:beta strand repeat-containing protein n=1 Tax=Sutterella wadsworthensis TaxID=40545 RepID=UPI003A93870C